MSEKQEGVLIPNPIAKFSLAEHCVYDFVRQGNVVYLLMKYNLEPYRFKLVQFLVDNCKYVVEKHMFASEQLASDYFRVVQQVYNYQIDLAKELYNSGYDGSMLEMQEIQNELQPRFQRLVNGGRMDKKEYIRLKTFAHVGYKPMIPVEYTDFLPCLHSERINHPDLSFVYSLVMPRSGKQNDEYNLYAAIEIAGFKTRADADKYKELQDAAYRYFDLSEPEKTNKIAIARMKKICTSIKLSATCLKRKVL